MREKKRAAAHQESFLYSHSVALLSSCSKEKIINFIKKFLINIIDYERQISSTLSLC